MLQFICPTGGEIYEVKMKFPRKLFYLYEGQEIEIEDDKQDCRECEKKLDQITESAREKAREELRAKKQE